MGGRDRVERAAFVRRFEASGQSAAMFASAEGLAVSSLLRWSGEAKQTRALSESFVRLVRQGVPGAGEEAAQAPRVRGGRSTRSGREAPREAPSFAPGSTSATRGRSRGVAVIFDGVRVRVGQGFDPEVLSTVLGVLRRLGGAP